ncbi:hypothetical protein [Streptomyces pactum]|uniref:Uncharacterized protein n=1 Tax=Streptomyces pactum TaxID=68249 RepID=A0A1S6JAL5_9ACTN|nr:hypothetical protein [Streptomyces pactum]AQS68798.1 hypothetical protein B1H29_19340 [Streptomyces pactum]
MSTPEESDAVIHLDLRSGAAELDTPPALRARVARQLGQAGLPEPDDPLFLVVDTPAGLTDHQPQYELLTGYRAVGEVRILVLLVGSAPGSYAGEGEAFQPDRRLVRPAVLRASGCALLWAGDLRSARTALERPTPDDPDALAVLVDVLSVPDVYLTVLDRLEALPDAVAAPGVRLLEQDLPPEVRDRAWRDALARFAGEDTELAPDVLATASSGADLPEPLRGLVTGRGARGQRHRDPDGVADDAYRACAEAIDRAEDALAGLGSLPGLLRPARREAFEADVDQARHDLDSYRELVGAALRGGGATASAAEAAARLAALGLRVPSAEGTGERIGEGLKEFAGKLLGQGLTLRSVAQRFTGLAGRVEPVPGTALLPRLAACPSGDVTGPAGDQDGARDRGDVAAVAGPAAAAAAGLLGALWQGPLLALALAVPLLFVGMAVLGTARLRETGRTGRWAVAPRVAACTGAAAGAASAYAADPPRWVSTVGLLLALGVAAETVRRLWRAAAGAWAPGHATAALRRALDELDALLAEAVREHWAVEERLYCADAARSVAGMLRATAAAAEAEAVPEPERPAAGGGSGAGDGAGGGAGTLAEDDWLSSTSVLETDAFAGDDDADWASAYARPDGQPAWDEPAGERPAGAPWEDRAASAPRWLDRENGEGGPELVATLAADLTDAALVAMDPYWGAVERGQAGALALRRTEERVRELLSAARRHLRHNGVLAPPPFAAARRVRATSASLLGTDPRGLAELVGTEADRQAVVQLSSPEQGTLLSRDPAAAVWIRFAPRAMRDEMEKAWETNGSTQPATVLWTSSGRYAGLLRLTPLRMGVVDTVRPRQSPGPDGTDPYGRPDAYGPRHPYRAASYDGTDTYGRSGRHDETDGDEHTDRKERRDRYERADSRRQANDRADTGAPAEPYARPDTYDPADPFDRADPYDPADTGDRADSYRLADPADPASPYERGDGDPR